MALNPKKIPAALQEAVGLHQRGQLDEAAVLYQEILKAAPTTADALLNYSTILAQRGQLETAETLLKRLVAVAPKFAYGHYAYANVLHAQKKYRDAAAEYHSAIALDPSPADFHHNEGVNHDALGDEDASIASYRRAIATQSGSPLSYFNCGVLLQRQGKKQEALEAYDAAIARVADFADAHLNRTMVLNDLFRFEDALMAGEVALRLKPGSALAYNNLGNALTGIGQVRESLAFYQQAQRLDPEYVDAQWNLAVNYLALGDFEKGYPLYECRWKTALQKQHVHHFKQPLWLGDASLEGKTIYVYHEQGYGDFIQKVRFIPLLLPRGARVLLVCFPALIPLIEYSMGHPNLQLLPSQHLLPEFDYHCPIMSLPLALKLTVDTIPNDVPYLRVPQELAERWRARLGEKTRPRIGLAWSGAAHHTNDQHRSIALERLAPLLALPFEFHSLQKEIRETDRVHLGAVITHEDELDSFADTAALVDEMDLIISVDTSIAHLSGAMAKPVWIMIPRYSVDYRWLRDREDSVWYPTARLFRQRLHEEWPGVIARVVEALSREVS